MTILTFPEERDEYNNDAESKSDMEWPANPSYGSENNRNL